MFHRPTQSSAHQPIRHPGGSQPKSVIPASLAGSSLAERRKFSKERSQSTSIPAALATKQPNHENHEIV